MKRILIALIVASVIVAFPVSASLMPVPPRPILTPTPIQPTPTPNGTPIPPTPTPNPSCNTIASGLIVYPDGHYLEGQSVPSTTDAYGYRYWNGKFGGFIGYFVNTELGFAGFPPYTGDYAAYIAANPGASIFGDPNDFDSFWSLKDLTLSIRWNDAYRSHTDCDGDGWFDRHWGYPTYQGSGAWYMNWVDGYYAYLLWDTYSKVESVPSNAVLVNGLWFVDDVEFGYQTGEPFMAGTLDVSEGIQIYP